MIKRKEHLEPYFADMKEKLRGTDKDGNDKYATFMKLLQKYHDEKPHWDMNKLNIAVDKPPMGLLNGKPSFQFQTRYIPNVKGGKYVAEYERYIIEQKTDEQVPHHTSSDYESKRRNRYQFVFEHDITDNYYYICEGHCGDGFKQKEGHY